jgi:hypothetical protein
LLLFGIFLFGFAAQDGYWDKRATTKEIVVSARDRIIKTDDFPVGTTELIYRITLLDDNQQMAGSFSYLNPFQILPVLVKVLQGLFFTVQGFWR